MKKTNCYNCKTEEYIDYAEENGFSLVKCPTCGLLYLRERPDDMEISQAHKQGKHSGLAELEVTGAFNADKTAQYMSILEDLFNGELSDKSSWLDVGCGHGEFMIAIQQYSHQQIETTGTEPNINKQQSARKRDLNVNYFDITSHKNKYDVISILNVYSHLPSPPEFIMSLKNLLNAEGELIIQTGDTANFSAKDHYKPFYLPDHLSFASEKIVTDILKRSGFEILNVSKYPYLSLRPKEIAKEIVKVFLPKYHSKIQYYAKWKRYKQTNMFIRAKRIN